MLWPRERQDLLIFGENKLTDIVHHFQALLTGVRHNFDEQACLGEWLELKMLVYRRPDLREQIVQNFGPTYSTADEFVNIFMVVELCLVIPVQTACVERGNGCLNRIMTDHRSTQQVVL